ncbi:MAG: lipoprotein [Syntrophothermus sp.]
MKRPLIFALLIFILAGCSGLPISIPFLQTPAPPVSPQPTVTPYALQTLPPSNTPDLFVINTAGPAIDTTGTSMVTATLVPTLTPTFRPTITLEPLDPTLFTPSPNVFLNVQRNTSQLVWGYTCAGDRSIRFIAQVQPVRRLRYVTLWYRLQDKYSGRGTAWGGGAIMSDNDQGTYFYDLQLSQIRNYRRYQDAWLQYQLVASTATRKVLGRSVVSRADVSLTNCNVLFP